MAIYNTHIPVVLWDGMSWRNQVFSEYKAIRDKADTPNERKLLAKKEEYKKQAKYIEKALGFLGIAQVRSLNMEADDLVSIWAGECRDSNRDYTVAGIDKDLLQIPGTHYNFVKKDPPRYVDADEANRLLMMQCLTGDTADNIKGLKGIGPKKAEKILEGVPMERRWDKVKSAYREHKASNLESDYILLKMLQSWSEYDNDILAKYPIITESKPDEDSTSKPERETTECEHNVSQEPSQDSSLQEVPDGDTGRAEGN